MAFKVGDSAPAFSLPDQKNITHTLRDFRGQWLLLYFYPKDDTPGCTVEACSVRDHWQHFKKIKATVIGVSVDSVESHQKFAKKYKLPFTLLADTNTEAVKAYGVWRKKKLIGHEYMGTIRSSFLIDPQGKIVKIYENVKPNLHAKEVIADLTERTKHD